MCNQCTSRTIRTRAFSLIELLVVIAIIAILIAIAIPSLHKAKDLTYRVTCAHNLKQIHLGMGMYLNDNDNAYPCTQDPVSTDPFYWLWMGRGWRGWLKPYLGGNVDVNDPSVLLCPEDRTDPAMYESTSYSYSMAFYHSVEQIDDINDTSLTYSDPQPSIPQHADKVATPAAKILIGEWFSNHELVDEEKGWWNWQGARNYLFVDGRIDYLKATEILPARDNLPNPNLTIHGIKGRDIAP